MLSNFVRRRFCENRSAMTFCESIQIATRFPLSHSEIADVPSAS
jgi:hypothetical protein